MKLLLIISMGFDIATKLFALEKNWDYHETIDQLFICFNKVYDSVTREVLYTIPVEFGVPMKLVGLIEMCLNTTYSKI
jgi:hypothetical protein